MARNLQVAGMTISFTGLAFLTLAIWVKALLVKIDPWFTRNADLILIVSTVMVFFFAILGIISFKAMLTKGNPVDSSGGQ